MTAKTKEEFPCKVSTKFLIQNYYFQNYGCFLLSGSPSDYWTHKFPKIAFCYNFNMTSYYPEDTADAPEDCCSVSLKL